MLYAMDRVGNSSFSARLRCEISRGNAFVLTCNYIIAISVLSLLHITLTFQVPCMIKQKLWNNEEVYQRKCRYNLWVLCAVLIKNFFFYLLNSVNEAVPFKQIVNNFLVCPMNHRIKLFLFIYKHKFHSTHNKLVLFFCYINNSFDIFTS